MRLIVASGIAALSLGAAAPALAAEAVTYSGTLGNLPIVVELVRAEGGGDVSIGRYAYVSKGVDIPLHGGGGAGGLTLAEEAPCTQALCMGPEGMPREDGVAPVGATWQLKADGQGLSGTWTKKGSAKGLPVALERRGARTVEETDYAPFDALDPASALYTEGDNVEPSFERLPYDVLKMEHPLETGREEKLGEGVYRLDTDRRIAFAFPTVVSIGDADVKPIDAFLSAERLSSSLASFSCMSKAYLGMGWTGQMGEGSDGLDEPPEAGNVTVDHLSERLMGFTESGSFYCGGAHPDNYTDHTVADVATGARVEPESLLVGWRATDADGKPVDPKADGVEPDTLTWGPDEKLTAFVREKRKRLDAESEAACGIDDLIASNLAVYFTQENLVFTLDGLPYAIQACADDLLEVPLKDARPLLTSEGARYFAVLDR